VHQQHDHAKGSEPGTGPAPLGPAAHAARAAVPARAWAAAAGASPGGSAPLPAALCAVAPHGTGAGWQSGGALRRLVKTWWSHQRRKAGCRREGWAEPPHPPLALA